MISTSIRAGELRNQITIQVMPSPRPRNADGGETRSDDKWMTYVVCAAKIDTAGGQEFMRARAVNATLTHEITIRWFQGIKPNMRVLFSDPIEGVDRSFNISSIVNPNTEIRYSLLLHCVELVGRTATT